MRDSGALTELLLTRLKKVEVPKNYVSLRKRLMENKPLLEGQFSLVGRQAYSAKAGAEYLNRRREDVATLRCREGVIYVRAMSALRRVLRLEIPACIQEHNQPRTSGIGALCQWARLESTGLFVGFDRREVLWAFVNKWKLTRWLILHKPLAEGNVVFRYFYLLQTG